MIDLIVHIDFEGFWNFYLCFMSTDRLHGGQSTFFVEAESFFLHLQCIDFIYLYFFELIF